MRVRFFGQFLLEKGLVSPADLKEALQVQAEKKQYFGTYALRLGYLDVLTLNELLRTQKKTGRRVGELAIEKGVLTKKQVGEILVKQKSDHLFLGEILVAKGILKREELYRHLDAFHREVSTLKWDDPPEDFPFDAIFYRIFQIFNALMTRTIEEPTKMISGEDAATLSFSTPSAAVRCYQREATFRVLFSVDDTLAPTLAESYTGEPCRDTEDTIKQDAMEEILNISVGNFLTYAQQLGEIWELEPPIIIPADEPLLPLYGEKFYYVLFATPEGEFHVCLDLGGLNASKT